MSEQKTTLIGDFTELPPIMYHQSLFAESSVKKHILGTIRPLVDGRIYVYSKAGAVALGGGKLNTYITTATKEGVVAYAAEEFDRELTITAAGVTLNEFEDGDLVIQAGTGIGEHYKIRGNTATDSDGLITLYLYDAIDTAWSTVDTRVALYPNAYNDLVVNPVDAQQRPVCVNVRPVTAEYYFWGLARGRGPLVMDVPNPAGLELDEKEVICSTNVAGCGMITTTAANADMRHKVGYVVEEADLTNTYASLIELHLI
jgi:hypothetical protein